MVSGTGVVFTKKFADCGYRGWIAGAVAGVAIRGRAGDTEAGTGTLPVDWADKNRVCSAASFIFLLLVSKSDGGL